VASKKSTRVSPLGESTRAAASRRRTPGSRYAKLEKKYEVALAIADLAILHRTRAKITQDELASRMGTSISAISRLESGFHVPSLETLRKLAEALGGRVKIEIVGTELPTSRARSSSLPRVKTAARLTARKK
jgi:ribosome-binding protein aMBF1 (putative translation factor)